MYCTIKHCARLAPHPTVSEFSRNLASCQKDFKCKLLVVGAGPGGCSIAWRFSKKLNDKDIIVLEPSKFHYNQPLFTLVAAGVKKISDSQRSVKDILPRNVVWFKDKVDEFDPCNNLVFTGCGFRVHYDFMVVALGLNNDYQKIQGLKEALIDPHNPVSTIYSPMYCQKCWCSMQRFSGGHAIFTFPCQYGKCPGAAQKIMYLANDYWTQNAIRKSTNITYNTGGSKLFGVTKYATALRKIAKDRDIVINHGLELLEIQKQSALFIDGNGKTISLPFNFLHVTPPMSPPACLTKCEELVNEAGYLNVNIHTLQHKHYKNVFGVGDCIGTPNSKTAAAIGNQTYVVAANLWSAMYNKELKAKYNGYGACVIHTTFKTAIVAEFLYDKKICETFPFDQSKESRLLGHVSQYLLPYIYWNKLLKGKWNGPDAIRKIINPLKL